MTPLTSIYLSWELSTVSSFQMRSFRSHRRIIDGYLMLFFLINISGVKIAPLNNFSFFCEVVFCINSVLLGPDILSDFRLYLSTFWWLFWFWRTFLSKILFWVVIGVEIFTPIFLFVSFAFYLNPLFGFILYIYISL